MLSISRLTAQKNHAAVIRAVAGLPHPVRLHVVGAGPEANRIRELARELAVDLVLVEEWQSDQEILDAYLRATVVVSLSRFEGFGLTPLEGRALGIPVVASDIAPHREFAGSGVTLVPLDDEQAAAHAIEKAIRGDLQHKDGGSSVAEWTIEACVARLLPRLERVLRRPG